MATNNSKGANGSTGDGGDGGRALNGRYQLISVVGGGGMAQVYKARDNILGRIVAVKVLREQYTSDPQFVARFRREAQAAANLAHPNIVNVYDVGQDGDVHYIVMEYVNGESLKELITRSAPFPADKAANVAIQILSGLEYAHRSGLVHRDIKPQNVLITPDGQVKVTDFGIAKSVSDLGLTEAGQALGTAHYFSPEQAKGERVVPQSDIYAVGVTLYEMLTGRLPFESENSVGLAYKHISEAPRPPRDLNPAIPPRLEYIVMRALAKEPGERYGSAAEMEKALRSFLAGGQQPTVEIPIAQPNVTRGGGRRVPQANLRGTQTGSLAGGIPRGGYPSVAGSVAGAGVGATAATRHMTSPLGAPASVAIRPAPARVQAGGGGCSAVAIGFIALGFLALLIVGGLYIGPNLPSLFTDRVVPTPTPTPIIPTATATPTTPPPTATPTSTPTSTPTATATPISVPVPQLVGLKVQDAEVLAKKSGFVLVELDRIESQYPEGVVAQQDPAPNGILKQTSRISVRVSSGPPAFKLPDLGNTDPSIAKQTLEQAGLKVDLGYEPSTSVPKDVVIRSVPPGGATVKPGDTVTLVISQGDVVAVPDLIGLENQDLAQKRIEAAGLSLGNVTEADDPNSTVPPGAVMAQDPPKGTLLDRGSPVNIQLRSKTSP